MAGGVKQGGRGWEGACSTSRQYFEMRRRAFEDEDDDDDDGGGHEWDE